MQGVNELEGATPDAPDYPASDSPTSYTHTTCIPLLQPLLTRPVVRLLQERAAGSNLRGPHEARPF